MSLIPARRTRPVLLHEKLERQFVREEYSKEQAREAKLQEIRKKHRQPTLEEIHAHSEQVTDKVIDFIIEEHDYLKRAAKEYKARFTRHAEEHKKAEERLKRRLAYGETVPEVTRFARKPLPAEMLHFPARYEPAEGGSLQPRRPDAKNPRSEESPLTSRAKIGELENQSLEIAKRLQAKLQKLKSAQQSIAQAHSSVAA
jgi:hypothetical protein